MAEFHPFDIPEDDVQKRPPLEEAQQPSQQSPEIGEKTPNNGFVNFLRRFWGVIAAVVVVVAVALIFGNAILARLAPAWALSRGAAGTAADMAERLNQSPYKAVGILGKSLLSGSVGCGFSYDDGYSSGSGQVTLTTAFREKSMSLAGAAMWNGQNLDAELFLNDQRAALRSSVLDRCYGITYATFEDDLRASALPDYFGMSEEEIQEAGKVAEQFCRTMELDFNSLVEACSQVSRDFLGNLEFSSGRNRISVGGQRISCTTVTTELDEEDLRNLVLEYYDALAGDEDVRNLAISAMAVEEGCTVEEAEGMYDEQQRTARSELESQLRSFQCDLNLTYCLSDNKLVQVQARGDVTADGSTVDLDMVLDFGQNPAEDDWVLSCNILGDSGDFVTMEVTYASHMDGEICTDSLTMGMDQGYGWKQASLETVWDRSSGDLSVSVYDGNDTQTVDCNLMVDGDSFLLTLNDFEQLRLVDASLEIVLTADQNAQLEEPEYVNLDQWDESALMQIQNSLSSLVNGTTDGGFTDYD